MGEKESTKDITRSTMIRYGIGGLGIALFSGIFGYTYNFYFYNFSSPSIDMGLILGYTFLIFAIWNAINDPIFGFISDRTRSRWGRRRPYIIFILPILVIGTLMLFFPSGSGFTFYFVWILVGLFIYDTGYTFVGLTYASLLPELTFSSDKRAKTNYFSVIFMGLGTGAALLVGFIFLQEVADFQFMAILFALLGASALLITGLTVKEKKQFMEVPSLGVKDALWSSFKNKSFITYEIFNFAYVLMYNILQIALIQFAISVLNLSTLEGTLMLGAFFLMSIISLPLMIYFNRKLGTKKTVLIFSSMFAGTLCFVFFIDSFIMALIVVMFVGFCYSAPMLLTALLIADVIDEDEVKTGRRREGMYFGANALITKPAISVAIFIVALFNTFFFFNPGFNVSSPKYIQAESALFSIRFVTAIIPAIFLVLGLLFFILYPLNKKRVEKLKKQLDEVHKKSKNV